MKTPASIQTTAPSPLDSISQALQTLLADQQFDTVQVCESGGTLAMAGLLSDETRQGVEGVPGVMELPVLGALFRSNAYKRKESELVILVTPYLATHAAKHEFARPDGGYAPSSSLRELFMGHINRIYGPPGYMPQGRYEGDFGFIVEYPGVK